MQIECQFTLSHSKKPEKFSFFCSSKLGHFITFSWKLEFLLILKRVGKMPSNSFIAFFALLIDFLLFTTFLFLELHFIVECSNKARKGKSSKSHFMAFLSSLAHSSKNENKCKNYILLSTKGKKMDLRLLLLLQQQKICVVHCRREREVLLIKVTFLVYTTYKEIERCESETDYFQFFFITWVRI